MTDRLTDAVLAELEDIALLRLSKADREAGTRLDGRAAIDVRDQAAKRYFASLVVELRERRAADLNDEERGLIVWLRGYVPTHSQFDELDPRGMRARAVLDKLIAGAHR